jgi:agmatinase
MGLEEARDQVDMAFTRRDARGMSFENSFGGATSFMRRRYTKDLAGVDLAVFGVPFDQAVTNRPGTRFGPRAIREASTLQAFDPPYGWDFNAFEAFTVVDTGDLGFDYARVQDFPAALQAHVAKMLEAGPGTLALGGDHSITLPILRAYAARFGPISLLQFDAHSDTWQDDDLDRLDHGTMFYKAAKLGIVDPASSVQVGIRTTNPDTMGFTILDAPWVHAQGPAAAVARIREILGDRPVYLTFDIDALDPAHAPGTGTPVWGGLSSAQAAAMLRGLAGINLVGADVIEVSPPFDHAGITAVAGAHVAVELVSLYCHNRAGRGRQP